jgi:hypothetical protein
MYIYLIISCILIYLINNGATITKAQYNLCIVLGKVLDVNNNSIININNSSQYLYVAYLKFSLRKNAALGYQLLVLYVKFNI